MEEILEKLSIDAKKTFYEKFLQSREYKRILSFIEGDNTIKPVFSIDCEKIIEETIHEVIDKKVTILLSMGFTKDDVKKAREYIKNTLVNSDCVILESRLKIISFYASQIIRLKKEIEKLEKEQEHLLQNIIEEIEELKDKDYNIE